ncbi:FAD-dependent oxidoreductase [Roseomonas sp. CCTCC AB2023176]|uniref:FAD-dependent oxidoreductase n=1 Tax=Roseomonas sp. CCTCC AB2023176 TaxID=3342640 RepID=UPI0035E14F8C
MRDTADARSLRAAALEARRAVVLGGGVIGLEAAASLRHLGLEVDVVEAAPRLMARNVPEDMAARLAAIHGDAGVRLHLGRRAASLTPDPLGVTLDDGTELLADVVVIGIGIVPETTLADAAGLGGPDGIPVDASYRTADDRVFAIGDVASVDGAPRNESWAHAASSARAAARAILGLEAEPPPIPWFWTTQHGHTLQVAGNPMAADRVAVGGTGASVYLRGDVPVGVAALDAPRDFARLRRGLRAA